MGLLIVLLAIALTVVIFRQAAQQSERKRQMHEWQDAKDKSQNVVSLSGFKASARMSA